MPVLRSYLAAAFALLPLATHSQVAAPGGSPHEAPDPVLGALISEALERNPDLRAAGEALASARQRPAQARSLANPMLGVTYTNEGWSPSLGAMEDSNLALMASQDLPFPGKRRLRGEIASLQADQVDQQVERVKLGVVAQVKRAYYGLLLARNLLQLIREQEEIWKQIEGVVRARYAVGQGAQQDVLRIQVEVTRIGQLRANQTAENEVRRAELNRLLDRPADAPLDSAEPLVLRSIEEAPDQLLARLRSSSPELRSARIAIERERLAVDLARKEFKPDFTLQAAYMDRGRLDPMWQAGVGVSIPIHRKRLSAGLAEADAQRRASERLSESVALQLRFRTQERLALLRATEGIAELYEKGIVPQDRLSFESALASYQAGRVPFITVLEALATLYGDRSTQLRLLTAHAQGLATLEEASLAAGQMVPSASQGMAGWAAPGFGTGRVMSSGDTSSMSGN